MSGVRFARFYPSDWRSGCMGLTLEQEGFYIRLCAYVYETGQRLPADDSAAAKFMGLHTNAYRKVKNQLVAIGKIIARDDGWTVARAEKELSAARFATSGRQADPDAGRDTRPDTLGDTTQETPIDTPLVSGGVFSETPNKNNGPSLEPVAIARVEEKKDSARVDLYGRPIEGPDADVSFDGSTIELVNGERSAWLKRFGGDDERLDLALTQAAAFIQPNSNRSLLVQVRAQLARAAGDKRDRDQRYAKAAEAKPAPTQAARPKSWADDRNDKARAFLALLKPTEATQ